MSGGIRLVVFDLDGTLVDSMGAFADQAAALMERHYGVPADAGRRQYLDTSGLPFRWQLERLFPGDARNEGVAEAFERWKVLSLPGPPLRPGAAECLAELRGRGYELAVSSNNTQANVDGVTRPWRPPLGTVLGYLDESFGKGRPHFRELSRIHGVPVGNMLFVGDSLNDLRIARGCGVPFLAMLDTFTLEAFRQIDPDVDFAGWDSLAAWLHRRAAAPARP